MVPRVTEAVVRACRASELVTVELELSSEDGTMGYFDIPIARIDDHEALCLVRDVTARRSQELRIIEAQNKLQATISAIPDLLFEVDIDGRYIDYHSPRTDLLAAPPEEFLGRRIPEILPPDAAAICMSALYEAAEDGFSTGRQFELDLPVGRRWFELSVSRKPATSPEALCFIVLSRDITERKEAESRIFRLAYFDTLTGLPNRQSFVDRLTREIQRATFHGGRLAVLFLDLDGFKTINDTLGHGAGDLLLQWVADRLSQSVRPTDIVARTDAAGAEVELARLGGDEFTVLMPQLKEPRDALLVARRIRDSMRRPFCLEGREVTITASVGVALYPEDGLAAVDLLKHADTAMYHAKDHGRDNCQFYSASLTQHALQRLNLENRLRAALERQEFFLVYQPQLDLRTGRIEAFEALIRWNHPERGLIYPSEFIPLAEENGMIVPIGEWVLRTACAAAARWHAAGHRVRLSVNLSPMQFRAAGLYRTVITVLAEAGLGPEWLEVEVTEGALMEDTAATVGTLEELRSAGVGLAVDDFGTGYSSLSYLKRLPLTALKVDKSFVRGLPSDEGNLAIVRTVISLAKNLGFRITAEGIETPEQARIVRELSCESAQGFYFSEPISGDEIEKFLASRGEASAPVPPDSPSALEDAT